MAIGADSNACQEDHLVLGSPGKDPCPELDSGGGIWSFDPHELGQQLEDGVRFATGLRDAVAVAFRPQDRELYLLPHGRDGLHEHWPQIYSLELAASTPAEVLYRVTEGTDFGWPYCLHDSRLDTQILAPEYGGDGSSLGPCAEKARALISFPAHAAPNGLVFYTGAQFPARYKGGAFVAFHGSWNREPLPAAGYNVTFVEFDGTDPTGFIEVFADGFAAGGQRPRAARHRPVGLAEGPDGSLFVSDSKQGRIYRIRYVGTD
ncbi:MAG: PQQ-dependent sugar dehydrogenase [Gemmatimonadetes bacterium]|nr:PQQ-dependent sugar dehydrogenase [Gemmatimonadota bacterium]